MTDPADAADLAEPAVAAGPPGSGDPTGPDRPLPGWLAATLVFVSSGAVLVLEIVGLRLVAPYVGVTLQTSSAVIGVALAAIAYGVWFGGWLADRRDPRRMLAPALVLAGITIALTLPVVRYAGEVLRGGEAGAVLVLTTAAIFLPAALLSAVTPLVIKLQLGDIRQTGTVVGRLSGIGTVGAITATLGTGFLLVAALPSSVIIVVLAALTGSGGLVLGGWLHRQHRTRTPAPRVTAAVAVLGLLAAGLAAVAPDPCDRETAYHCASIEPDPERPDGRLLLLNGARHSYVDLADPTHLEFAYIQWFAEVIDAAEPAGRPLAAAHLGAGGLTMPGWLTATRPGSDQLVLELDPGVVELDQAELGAEVGPELTIVVGDARVSLATEPTASRDLVIGDAFGHLTVPWHLTTREFTADIRRVLRPGGVYTQNLIDREAGRFARAQVATVAEVFEQVALIASPAALAGERSGNYVLLAADTPLPLERLAAGLGRLDPQPRLLAGEELADWLGPAPVLTDDHAPVDQLLR